MDKARSPFAEAMVTAMRTPGARIGAVLLGAFVFLALAAPLLASETALLWWDGSGLRFPALVDLFNRRAFPKHHDLLFNLALLAALPTALACLVWRRAVGTTLGWAGLGVVALWIACQIPCYPTQFGWRAAWDDRPARSETIQAYRAQEMSKRSFAIFALIPHRADAPYEGLVLKPPGTVNPATGARMWAGTDSAGFDVAARMIFGTRISLTIGFLATGLAMAIGLVIGAAAGFFGGLVDLLLSRLIELMMCFPTFVLILVVVAMTSRDIFIITLVIGLTGWAGTARLVRGEFLAQASRDYVLAGRAIGLSSTRLMFRHILPNCAGPLLISATFGVAGSVSLESGLAFIGLGDPNVPSWGMILDQGRANINDAWLIYVPGFAVFLLVVSLNLLGQAINRALDPRGH